MHLNPWEHAPKSMHDPKDGIYCMRNSHADVGSVFAEDAPYTAWIRWMRVSPENMVLVMDVIRDGMDKEYVIVGNNDAERMANEDSILRELGYILP